MGRVETRTHRATAGMGSPTREFSKRVSGVTERSRAQNAHRSRDRSVRARMGGPDLQPTHDFMRLCYKPGKNQVTEPKTGDVSFLTSVIKTLAVRLTAATLAAF